VKWLSDKAIVGSVVTLLLMSSQSANAAN